MASFLPIGAVLFIALGCASASQSETGDREVTLTRGGGITGLSETIHIWTTPSGTRGTYDRSDRPGSRPLQLGARGLDSALTRIQSLVASAPAPPSQPSRTVCADVILIHIDFRRSEAKSAVQEECPHQSAQSEQYWNGVDKLFRDLSSVGR